MAFNSSLYAEEVQNGYIRVIPVQPETFQYIIELHLVKHYAGTDLLMSDELDFGDGSDVVDPSKTEPSLYRRSGDIEYYVYRFTHVYPGPGEYRVRYVEYFRYATNNLADRFPFTPFYIETWFVIDPYVGLNSTPVICNQQLFIFKKGNSVEFNLLAMDKEQDRVAYRLSHPKTGFDLPANQYDHPITTNPATGGTLTRLSLDQASGKIFWDGPVEAGYYALSVEVVESHNDPDKPDQNIISRTRNDLNFQVLETPFSSPRIIAPEDTAILAGKLLNMTYRIQTDPSDTILLQHLGSIFLTTNPPPQSSLSDTVEYIGNLEGQLTWQTSLVDQESIPYTFYIGVRSRNSGLTSQLISHIWISDKESDPSAPTALKATRADARELVISWKDNANDEVGYVIERADELSPEFRRIAGLPANTTSYTDRTVLEGRSYRYRTRALGTINAPYSEELIVEEDIILNTDIDYNQRVRISPNPVENVLLINFMDWPDHQTEVTIYDISGKLIYRKTIHTNSNKRSIDIEVRALRPGIYLLHLRSGAITRKFRFIKK